MDMAGRSGIEVVRAMMRGEVVIAIAQTIGFALIEVDDGRVVFESTPGAHVYNPINSVHGGFAATLLDSACGCAVHTKLASGQSYTTLELKIAYHKAITTETGKMSAEGNILTIGRRVAFTEARLTDAAGQLYASATSTLLIISP